MIGSADAILDRAIAGRMAGTLTEPPDERRQWQVRFLAHGVEHDGIWIEPLDEAKQSLDPHIAGGCAVQVAICLDHARFAFRSSIIRRNKHFWLTESMMFEALLLRGPIELFEAERRAHRRFLVPDANNIFTQITCPTSLFPLRVKTWDLSEGGVSFLCPRDTAAMRLGRDETIEFSINYRGRTTAGRGLVRFSRFLTERVIKIGVELDRDSMNEPSHQNLQHFLSDAARLARPPRDRRHR
jgi:hypothetical protein